MASYPELIDYLNKCVKNNLLAHAYIFYGPDEESKKETAFWFARKILDNKNFKFHPDLFSIKAEIDENITINLIRQLKKFLILSPYSSKYKVVIIEAAEKLNAYAQNALLKIFEEAPSHAVIIICFKTLDSALETIVSRGIKLPFWRNQAKTPLLDKSVIAVFNKFLETDFSNRYFLIEKLDSHKPIEFFEMWLKFLRAKFLSEPTTTLTRLLKNSQNIYFKLNETNINPKFAYDELFLWTK